jgi:hypothetical protein
VIDHIAEGFGSWAWLEQIGLSCHFVIQQDGTILQGASIFDSTLANGLSHRNGIWYNARGVPVTPSWSGLKPEVNPNL